MAVLSWEQVAAVALAAGFPPGAAVIATAITEPESGRNATIVQAGQPYATTGWGLWQITPGDSEPAFGVNNAMLVPRNNAMAAHAKWAAAGGFSPWTTYMNGLERPYIGLAEAAVAKLAHLSRKQLAALAAQANKAAGAAGSGAASSEDWSPLVKAGAEHLAGSARTLLGYAHGTDRLRSRFRPPKVTTPSPAGLLWHPAPRRRP